MEGFPRVNRAKRMEFLLPQYKVGYNWLIQLVLFDLTISNVVLIAMNLGH